MQSKLMVFTVTNLGKYTEVKGRSVFCLHLQFSVSVFTFAGPTLSKLFGKTDICKDRIFIHQIIYVSKIMRFEEKNISVRGCCESNFYNKGVSL